VIVAADFRPSSVTFVGTDTGWLIGQAGTPGHCATEFCTSVARTDDAGESWTGVPAPLTGADDSATGVSQIRFLNLDDGWAFGPQLWAPPHDGGQTWAQVGTHGQRVTDLETVGDRVFAASASRAAAAVAEAGGSVAQVKAVGQELAGGVMPSAFDVELHPGHGRSVSDPVRDPVRVPRPGVRWVVGEQVGIISQLDSDRYELCLDLSQVALDQRTGDRVDGKPAVLVGLGVLADALSGADHVVEGDVDQAAVEVDVTDLQAAQLTAADTGDHY